MIRWRDVTVRFKDRAVLRRVSLEVPAGQRLALVGPNGAGKTTLLRCLLGLVPFEGEVQVGGYDVLRQGALARALIGYVPQLPAFPPYLTAAEVVALAQELRGEKADPWPLLERVGLGPLDARKPVPRLSGGTLRRLSLAVAMAGDPPVLVLDEPGSYLDREGAAWLSGYLREAEGKTVVVTGHRLRRLEQLVDRVVMVKDGEIVADIPAADLRRLHWVEVVVPEPGPAHLPPGVRILGTRNGAVHLGVPDALLVELLRNLEGRRFQVYEPEEEVFLEGLQG